MQNLNDDASDNAQEENSCRKSRKKSGVQYFVIKDSVIIASFNSFYEACQYGLERFETNEFLVEKSTDR